MCKMFVAVVYLVIGFGTFAHVYETLENTHDKGILASITVVLWPIYWSGTGALASYRAAKQAAQPAEPPMVLCWNGGVAIKASKVDRGYICPAVPARGNLFCRSSSDGNLICEIMPQ